MNSEEVKNILLLYRAGSPDAAEEQVEPALDEVKRDPDLRRWFEQTSRFHEAMREKFQELPVPPGLRESILARRRIIRPLWWQRRAWAAAAAGIVLLLSLSALWLQQPRPRDHFSDYRARMVRTAL